ncbi:thiamine pyrophosphate-binding protein [Litoreibacter roseus]|uniref:Thiamine pyrophosphate protein n=1 Tax=Litoreibacter roseus TaxID=2601869 RepID=A0A6N6JF59_9RHOB|nr:thiamine pyrophosphate-binding protein [Litoreibacter roseus]GFE64993.1 thiamine pyrophosphate protein [Litoreibacter roseus]
MGSRHGGQILADQLAIQGVKRVFSVPGESFLAALDGLYDSGIENVVCRQEGAAAMMAEAHGKLTNTPGVLFVTRGPGATNASSGIHVARQDSTPMVVFVGQIARGHRDREAFQEVDYRAMFGPLAKWVTEVDQTARLPEYIARAFSVAMSGRPGPVVLALPEDMLSGHADTPDRPKVVLSQAKAHMIDAERIAHAMEQAERPLVIAGGPGWSVTASDNLATFAAAFDVPVAVPFRRQDYLDNRHVCYVGDLGVGMNPALAAKLKDADFLLALGTRLGDIATGSYELMDPAATGKTICHVHPEPEMPGLVYHADIPITANASAVLTELTALSPSQKVSWAKWRAGARAAYETWQAPQETPGSVKMEQVIAHLSETLPENAILTNGAGNYAAFLHRYFTFKKSKTQLAPTSGSMGYGFPAAIAAKLQHPDVPVICLAGDGCFQMTLNEMSTAIQHGAAVVVIVANNGKYGTIRMHQEKTYPGRVSGTELSNPDFAALARAYGGMGQTVERTEDFPAALDNALAAGTLAVIELKLDDEVLSTGLSLSETRKLGEAATAS